MAKEKFDSFLTALAFELTIWKEGFYIRYILYLSILVYININYLNNWIIMILLISTHHLQKTNLNTFFKKQTKQTDIYS